MDNKSGLFEPLEIRNNKQFSEGLQFNVFYDNNPLEGENVYRIKSTYLDNDSQYSSIKKVVIGQLNDFLVYPNPTDEEAWIDLKAYEGLEVKLIISNLIGTPIEQVAIKKVTSTPHHVDLSNIPTGLYFIKIQTKGKRDVVKKIQITK